MGLTRTDADNSSASSLLDARLTEIEDELAGVRRDMRGLLNLKEQLQRALDGLRQQRAAAALSPEQPSSSPPDPQRNEAPAPRPVMVPRSPQGAPAPLAAKAPLATNSVDGVTVVHLEDRLALQAALRTAVEKYGYARYRVAGDAGDGARHSRTLLAVNLLLEGRDPLLAVQSASEWGLQSRCAFTYCADETRGMVLGMVDFFPPPFEPDDCVTRLLERGGAAQRLLIVSDAVDATTELRSILTRLGCATSVAFDARQALLLIPMVNPDIILVDLNLPKGEGLRVIGRVRADPANRDVVFALMWQTAIDHGEFRQQAARVVRDFVFSGDDLRRGISRELSPGGAGFLSSPLKVA